MVNYQNSKIYKICSYNTDDIYIGSTTQKLCKRLREHKERYNKFIKTGERYISSCEVLKHGNYYIELIEECPCDNREQLHRTEGEYIRKIDCVNKIIAGRTQKEWREDNKEKIKETKKKYYEENKEEIALQGKKYRENNKEEIALRGKKYYEENKEEIAFRGKKYRENNKEKIKEAKKKYYGNNKEKIKAFKNAKHLCECGVYYTHNHKKRHERSKRHINKLLSL